MTLATQTNSHTTRSAAASALQILLPEVVALTLHAKQAHWNMTGPGFLSLHSLTDEIAAGTRTWADQIAERALALDVPVDAHPTGVLHGLEKYHWRLRAQHR
jgi:starvation-inducible DNA-binding protein